MIVQKRRFRASARRGTNDSTWLDALLEEARLATAHSTKNDCRTRVALQADELRMAEELVRKRYAARGYQVAAVSRGGDISRHERVTVVAENDGDVVGTLTVRPGTPQGLMAEMSYGAEIEQLRRNGHVLGEVVKLAVDDGADSRSTLDALVRSAYVVSRFAHGRSHVVIEVNPRHVRFYEKVIGFVVAGAERLCQRVGAPSVLMELDLEQFGRRLQLAAGKVRPALQVVA